MPLLLLLLLNTTRLEALGLGVAGMSFARDWKGPVKWYLDNNGARRSYRKNAALDGV
jgi:hypothetical protein